MKDDLGRTIPRGPRLSFTRGVLAECLWEYGEDELAERAFSLSDEGLASVERLALWHRINDPSNASGRPPLNALILARGGIDYFERVPRDPVRRRRRTRPEPERYYSRT